VQLQKTLNEGKSFMSRRLQFLEVAHVKGRDVARCLMEKNTFLIDLNGDMQKHLKRVRKDAKALKRRKSRRSLILYFFRRGRGGFQRDRGDFRGGVYGHQNGVRKGPLGVARVQGRLPSP
jgi:hypothetical protein